MIKAKQIQGLENLESLALVSASQAADGTVTLTRGDGVSLSFATGAGLNGSTGDQGPKGDTGPDGLGPYEMMVANGYEGTEVQWRASLKGETGNPGSPGADGAQGNPGITPTFQTTVSVTSVGVGNNPTVMRNTDDEASKTYSLSLGIPQGKPGSSTNNGTSYTIKTTGSISKSTSQSASAAAASLSWSGTVGTVNITLPTGITGDPGSNATGSTGGTPTLSNVTKGTDLAAGSTAWTCSRAGGYGSKSGAATTYTIALSKAAAGDKGATGAKGPAGQSSGTYIGSYFATTESQFVNLSDTTIPTDRTAFALMYRSEGIDGYFQVVTFKPSGLYNGVLGVWYNTFNFWLHNGGSAAKFSGDEYGGFVFLYNGSWYSSLDRKKINVTSLYQYATSNPVKVTKL